MQYQTCQGCWTYLLEVWLNLVEEWAFWRGEGGGGAMPELLKYFLFVSNVFEVESGCLRSVFFFHSRWNDWRQKILRVYNLTSFLLLLAYPNKNTSFLFSFFFFFAFLAKNYVVLHIKKQAFRNFLQTSSFIMVEGKILVWQDETEKS